MTDKFHRFTQPTYTGAPSIPNPAPGTVTFNGVVYDFINVVPGGTGGSGSAFADGEKTSGPNAGTYWVSFGEDATSSDANRGMRALAENTDTLDDLFHQDIAYSVLPPYVTAVGTVSSIILLGPGIFVGNNVSYPLEMLFEIVDDLNREIYDPTTGQKITVTSISGATIGAGFSTGNVTLTLNHSIASGQTYSVWYGQRTSLATLPVDALNFHRIRADNEVDAEVEFLFNNIQGPTAATIPWNQTPTTSTLFDLASGGLNERYNRQAGTVGTISPPENYWTTNPILGTYYPGGTPTAFTKPGGGGWFMRTGPAVTGYSEDNGAYTDPINGLFNAKIFDTGRGGGSGGATGFTVYGNRLSGSALVGEGDTLPGAAAFLQLWQHNFISSMHPTLPYTRILTGASAVFLQVGAFNADSGESIVEVTAAGNYFRNGSSASSVNLGYDLLECTYNVSGNPVTQTYVIVGHGSSVLTTDPTKVRVRNLDGTCPNFSAAPTGTIRWISTTFGIGDGAGAFHSQTNTDVDPVLLDGLFYQVPPALETSFADNVPRTPPSFSAFNVTSTSHALQWGGFNHGPPYTPTFNGTLNGDGGMSLGGVANFFDDVNFAPGGGGATITFNSNTNVLFYKNVTFESTSRTIWIGGSTIEVNNGTTFNIWSDVTFGSTTGSATMTFGGAGYDSQIVLYGDGTNMGSFNANAGSHVNLSGEFTFTGTGTTGATNNNATFGSTTITNFNGTVNFNVSSAVDVFSTVSFATVQDFTSGGAATAPAINVSNGGITFGTTLLPGTTPAANTAYANSFIKASASAIGNGSSAFNAGSTGINTTLSWFSDEIVVAFATPMSGDYTILFEDYSDSIGGNLWRPFISSGSKLASGFTIQGFRNVNGGGTLPSAHSVVGLVVSFAVLGNQ